MMACSIKFKYLTKLV